MSAYHLSDADQAILQALFTLLRPEDFRFFELVIDPLVDDSIRRACVARMSHGGLAVAIYAFEQLLKPKSTPLPSNMRVVSPFTLFRFQPGAFGQN